MATEREKLEQHLREHHPNLLGEGPDSRFGRSPLPRELGEVGYDWLLAIHDANHAGLYVDHGGDDWLCRHPRDPPDTAGHAEVEVAGE